MIRYPVDLARKVEALLIAEKATLADTITVCGAQMIAAAKAAKVTPAKLAAIVLSTYAEHNN